MEPMQGSLWRLGVEGACRHMMRREVVEQRAGYGGLADTAFVCTYDDYRWLGHCPTPQCIVRPHDALRPARKPDRRHGPNRGRFASYPQRAAVLHTPRPDSETIARFAAAIGRSRHNRDQVPCFGPQGPDKGG